ncbi:MAG: hypothetical protein J0I45_07855 [Bosea sp.]|nr:hypothetical protein [Bosea sp. (in: a-proteobacteria)]
MWGRDEIGLVRLTLPARGFVGPAMLAVALLAAAPSFAQSTNQQIETMEQKLDSNATIDTAALGFQDDLAKLEQCQSACKPLIEQMMAKYRTDPKFGGDPKLGASDATQLAAALANAAATLPKAEATAIGEQVTTSLGADAGAAFSSAYAATTAPYNPQ